jgi:hypothetical protein
MSYQAEHLGIWYGNGIISSATTTTVTLSDGNNTATTAGTTNKWNITDIYYEIVSSTNATVTVVESGASPNTFATIGGTGSQPTNGYRHIKWPGRGEPCANANRSITMVSTGTILMNYVVVATREGVA